MSMGGGGTAGARKMAKSEAKISAAAAEKMTEIGDSAMDFTQQFYDTYVKPQLPKVQAAMDTGIENAATVFGQQQQLFADREGTYQTLAKPAIGNYFDMVNNFDPEAEAQQRGIAQQGDIISAGQNAMAQTTRGLNARGVLPAAGVVNKAQQENNLTVGLARAQAMNRLRNLTTAQGMQMKGEAATFGAGLGAQAGALPGQSLQAGVIGSDVAASGVGTTTKSAAIPLAGMELAGGLQSTIYSGSKSAQASAQSAATQAASQDGGIGGLLGSLGGAFLGTEAGAGALLALSDPRLKKDVVYRGVTPDGLSVYEFSYAWDDERRLGFMADEVAARYPEAVGTINGFLAIDYAKTRFKPWQLMAHSGV